MQQPSQKPSAVGHQLSAISIALVIVVAVLAPGCGGGTAGGDAAIAGEDARGPGVVYTERDGGGGDGSYVPPDTGADAGADAGTRDEGTADDGARDTGDQDTGAEDAGGDADGGESDSGSDASDQSDSTDAGAEPTDVGPDLTDAGAEPTDSGGGSCLSTEPEVRAAFAAGADAVLCPGTIIAIHQRLVPTADRQQIYTQGLPTGASRATLIIDPSATSLDAIIDAEPISGSPPPVHDIAIRSLILDGNARVLGKLNDCPWAPDNCHGLVNLGNAVNPVVEDNAITDARTWSHLVLTTNGGGCTGARVLNNQVGPSLPAPDDHYTDGISVNCSGSTVSGNNITDVTDGAIVVFAQENVTVKDNTIVANTAHMNLAIGVTDYIQGCGSYRGTVFSGNAITSAGAAGGFIYVGIAAGNHLWFGSTYDTPPSPCTERYNQAATIVDNTLTGPGIGLGIPVSGATGFTIERNTLNATGMLVDETTVTASALDPGFATVRPGALDSAITHAFWVHRQYASFTGRTPDAVGFAAWLAGTYPCDTAALQRLTRDFIAGAEPTAYLATLTPEEVATAVYRAVLDREPDPAGLAAAAALIRGSASNAAAAADLADSFYRSAEYVADTRNGAICPFSSGN